MRVLFGVVGLLIALAIVGALVKSQLGAVRVGAGMSPAVASPGASANEPSVREQSQQLQQEVRQDVSRAMQEAADRNAAADK